MPINETAIQNMAQSVSEWERQHPNDRDLYAFLDAIRDVAINQAATIELGWKNDTCSVNYENQPVEVEGRRSIAISREKAAWMLGLTSVSWLSKLMQGKVDVGHCWTHKKDTGQPCEQGARFHTEIKKQMATDLRRLADILDS